MTEWHGYAGQILWVDLGKVKIRKKALEIEMAKKFLGGRGFNMKILWDEMEPGVDPLGPENVLCFGFGPLSGVPVWTTGKFNVSAKSPLTGVLGDSNCGGHFAAKAKSAGYDQLVVTGKAPKPVYLWISDDDVSIKNADHLLGMGNRATLDTLVSDLSEKNISIASIGQAGENLVRFANVAVDCDNFAGRTGMGAVMGSKNLKAIAVKGTKGVKARRPDMVRRMAKDLLEWYRSEKSILEGAEEGSFCTYETFGRYGTLSSAGPIPTIPLLIQNSNYQSWELPGAENLDGRKIQEFVTKLKSCFGCPLHCIRNIAIDSGRYAGTKTAGPQLETVMHLGWYQRNVDLETVLKANALANDYGIDTISLGHVIGDAVEWYQKGIITEADTEGMPLEYGNGELEIEWIHKIAEREGFGGILAEGIYNAARILGNEAMKYVNHAHGMCHVDMRQDYMVCLQRMTSTIGASHLRGDPHVIKLPEACTEYVGDSRYATEPSISGKERVIAFSENWCALADSLTRCKNDRMQYFFRIAKKEELLKGLFAVTGMSWTFEELIAIGERVYNLEQAINVREGVTRETYRLPWRFANESIPNGAFEGAIVTQQELDAMLDNYFEFRGWDKNTTAPNRAPLERLGLENVADELEAGMPYRKWEGPALETTRHLRSK